MLTSRRFVQKGDTLIEVLFAVTVFSLVAVSTLSIMNQGSATAQRSLEITQVRHEMDGQAETIRFIHDSYIAAYPNVTAGPALEWSKITAMSISTPSQFGDCPTDKEELPLGAFVVNAKTAKLETDSTKIVFSVPTYSQLRYRLSPNTTVVERAEGIWVQAVKSKVIAGETSGFIDFHIRACWEGPGQAVPMTLGTIVRLYEPRP